MMKHIIKNIAFSMTCVATTLLMASCDTDVESVNINEPAISNQNAGLYQNYLTGLRTFKASKHKVSFGWFDNSVGTPCSQGQHISAAPDSLDYIVMETPANITGAVMQEMQNVREQKGTKVLCKISFEAIKSAYDIEEMAFSGDPANKGKAFTSFNTYLVDSVNAKLNLCVMYNYDGVVMCFNGKQEMYMSDDEKAEAIAQENDFMGIAKDWAQRHTDKVFVMAGYPQYITDQSIFSLASYVVIPCQSAASLSNMTYLFSKAAVDGVPADKLLPLVSMTSLDATDLSTGYWSKGTLAVMGAAQWVASDHDGYSVAGLAVENVNNDYYNAAFTYPHVRKAITIINPTVKN